MNHSPSELSISVIVPVFNGGDKFRRCLASLNEAHPPPGEIIVVSDGDTDGSWQVASDFGAHVLRFPSRGGPARARNLGAAHAKGDVLLFVDADVTIPPGAIGHVLRIFNREPDVAAIFGSYDDEPDEPNFPSQYRNLLHHYVHQQGLENASTFWGGCGAIRREMFVMIGGFDEGYVRPSAEDIELGYRLTKFGHRIRLCKSLQVKHLKRWDFVSILKADFFQRALPWTEIIFRYRNLVNDLNIRMSGRVSVVMVFLLLSFSIASFWQPLASFAVGLIALMLLVLNAHLYLFFFRKRGVRFTLCSIPWHWLYFFYSGVAFAVGAVRHFVKYDRFQRSSPPSSLRDCQVHHRGWSGADEG